MGQSVDCQSGVEVSLKSVFVKNADLVLKKAVVSILFYGDAFISSADIFKRPLVVRHERTSNCVISYENMLVCNCSLQYVWLIYTITISFCCRVFV